MGDLKGYSIVWFADQGIANILSLALMRRPGYHRIFDSANCNKYRVLKPGRTTKAFIHSKSGVYFHETDGNTNGHGVAFVNMVADSCSSGYTNCEWSQAVLARQIQRIIESPSTRSFLQIVVKNLILNCTVTRKDIVAADNSFGTGVASLKGHSGRNVHY